MNILDFLGFQPVLNNLDFVVRARKRKDISQIFYRLGVKFAFLCFGIKTSLAEMLKYLFYIPVMFGHVICVDKYIIQINHDTNIQKVGENVVHESLEGCRNIGITKRYYRPFK